MPGVPADVVKPPAPPAPPESPPNSPEDDDIPETVPVGAKADQAWQRVRKERREFRKEAARLQAEVERLSQQERPEVEEVSTLRQKIQEYESRLGQYDLAATQDFQQRFDAPMGAALQRAKSLLVRAGRTGDDASALVQKLAAAPDYEAVQALVEGEPFALQGALVQAHSEYADLADKRQEALQHWEETRAAVTTESARAKEVQLMDNIERDTEVAVKQAVKEGNWMFSESQEDPEWNAGVADRVRAVKGLMRSGSPAEVVKYVVEGLTAQPLRQLYAKATEELQALRAENARLVGATPSLGGGGAGRRAPSGKVEPLDIRTAIDQVIPSRPQLADHGLGR